MSLRLSRIFHAGYVLAYKNTQILFDPLFESPFSRNGFSHPPVKINSSLLEEQSWDAVFISHYHDDHCSLESLKHISKSTPLYVYCVHEELFTLLRDFGFECVYPLELGLPITLGSISIIPTRALDADVDCLLQIFVEEFKILNVVDAWIDENTLQALAQKAPWDLVLWPFQTMQELQVLSPSRAQWSDGELPIEWKEQLLKLGAHCIIPSACQFIHEDWSWYRSYFFPISYHKFSSTLAEWGIPSNVLRLEPGQSVIISPQSIKRSASLPWIEPLHDSLVDYTYSPHQAIPHTREIAWHFPQLSVSEKNIIDLFCKIEIPQRWLKLNAQSPKPQNWKLSLYGHKDEDAVFYYQIEEDRIRPVDPIPDSLLEWHTEIPVQRLLGAITHGETLSSLYIRINDQKFSADTEEKLAKMDLTDDPLLRCLYEGVFANYQRAQLLKMTPGDF